MFHRYLLNVQPRAVDLFGWLSECSLSLCRFGYLPMQCRRIQNAITHISKVRTQDYLRLASELLPQNQDNSGSLLLVVHFSTKRYLHPLPCSNPSSRSLLRIAVFSMVIYSISSPNTNFTLPIQALCCSS